MKLQRPKKTFATIIEKCLCSRVDRKGCWRCKGTGSYTRKEQTFLCIGGPLDGQRLNWSGSGTAPNYSGRIAVRDSYVQFNAAYRRGKGNTASAVFIHSSLV